MINQLDIMYPIIQAPMAGGATTPELVAAVSNAGALGSLGAGYMSPNEIRHAIKKIRTLTDKPFAVNLFIPEESYASSDQIKLACVDVQHACSELDIAIELPGQSHSPLFEEQIKVIIENKVPVFSFTFGLLDASWVSELKRNKVKIIGAATSLQEALLLEENGIDIIVAQGCEAGGHRGTFLDKAENALMGLMSLIPELAKHIKIPVIAAGGIMSGKAIQASMVLGAAGVQMGTAFLSCPESGINDQYKHALLSQEQDDTVLTRAFSGKMARGIRNKFISRMSSSGSTILEYPIQNTVTQVMRKKAKEVGNIDFMSMWAGQSVSMSRGVSAKQLVAELVNEIHDEKTVPGLTS